MKSLIYSCYICCILLFVGCSSGSVQHQDPIPEHETFTVTSQILGEDRLINVWTPPQYASETDTLPVLYMLDGGIQEDFPHIANTLAELIASDRIPAFILVGIENTQRRRDLTGFTTVEKDKEIAPVVGESGNFREFIREELFDEVSGRYRVASEKGIIGESLAGLFVVETFMLAPEMFDYYISFDPSIWWNDQHLLKTAEEYLSRTPVDQQKRFWFAGSDAADISPATNNLSAVFRASALPNVRWHYSDEPGEKHSTIFRATKEKALIWTLNAN